MTVKTTDRFRAQNFIFGGPTRNRESKEKSYKEGWQDTITSHAPRRYDRETGSFKPTFDARMSGGKGDAFRHYVTARLLSQILSSRLTFDASMIIIELADLTEDFKADPENAKMDHNNNTVGAQRGASNVFTRDFWNSATLDFMDDLAKGRIMVLQDGKARYTDHNDIYREPYERPYTPDLERYKDPFNSGETLIA